jgi:Insect cuticle protein
LPFAFKFEVENINLTQFPIREHKSQWTSLTCDFDVKLLTSESHELSILLPQIIQLSNANWGSPSSSQYHIQTDEGPERFFRYQTDNGQFRKEKRLQDGTVIGTNAWIDGHGYLRQNDYIADHEGYRILKSKTVFVGKDRPIKVRF